MRLDDITVMIVSGNTATTHNLEWSQPWCTAKLVLKLYNAIAVLFESSGIYIYSTPHFKAGIRPTAVNPLQ